MLEPRLFARIAVERPKEPVQNRVDRKRSENQNEHSDFLPSDEIDLEQPGARVKGHCSDENLIGPGKMNFEVAIKQPSGY